MQATSDRASWFTTSRTILVLAVLIGSLATGCSARTCQTGTTPVLTKSTVTIPPCAEQGDLRLPYAHIAGDESDVRWLAERLDPYTDGILTLCHDAASDTYPIVIRPKNLQRAQDGGLIKPQTWDIESQALEQAKTKALNSQAKQHYHDAAYLVDYKQRTWVWLSAFVHDTSTAWLDAEGPIRKSRTSKGWEMCPGEVRAYSKQTSGTYSVTSPAPPLRAMFGRCMSCDSVPNKLCAEFEGLQLLDVGDIDVVLVELKRAIDRRFQLGGYDDTPDVTALREAVEEFVLLHTFLHFFLHELAELYHALTVEYAYPDGYFRCHWEAERHTSQVTRVGVLRKIYPKEISKDPLFRLFCAKNEGQLDCIRPLQVGYASHHAAWRVSLPVLDTDFVNQPQAIVDLELDFFFREQ
ncbi:MAG: hypothetical protein GY716_17350 [bacterium]|nr:hypothetical protein [bacterium]